MALSQDEKLALLRSAMERVPFKAIQNDKNGSDRQYERFRSAARGFERGENLHLVSARTGWGLASVTSLQTQWQKLKPATIQYEQTGAGYKSGYQEHIDQLVGFAERLSSTLAVPSGSEVEAPSRTEWPLPWTGTLGAAPSHVDDDLSKFSLLGIHLESARFPQQWRALIEALGAYGSVVKRAKQLLVATSAADRLSMSATYMNLSTVDGVVLAAFHAVRKGLDKTAVRQLIKDGNDEKAHDTVPRPFRLLAFSTADQGEARAKAVSRALLLCVENSEVADAVGAVDLARKRAALVLQRVDACLSPRPELKMRLERSACMACRFSGADR